MNLVLIGLRLSVESTLAPAEPVNAGRDAGVVTHGKYFQSRLRDGQYGRVFHSSRSYRTIEERHKDPDAGF